MTFSLAWDLPIVEFGGGRRWRKRYTDEWGASGDRAFEIAVHGLERRAAWRAAIEAWQAPDPRRPRTARTGTRPPCSTSSTTWSTAGRSGARELESGGQAGGVATAPGLISSGTEEFGLLECFDYPYYNTVGRQLLRLIRDPRAVAAPRAR